MKFSLNLSLLSREKLILLGVCILHVGVFAYVLTHLSIIQDEVFHFDQIGWFYSHYYHLQPLVTTIPGYHLVIATALQVFHTLELGPARIVSFMISFPAVLFFYLAALHVDKKSALVKTVQFAFFPLSIIFYSLVYTDILSVGLLLWSLYEALRGKYFRSGGIGILSLLVRQNNIIWLAMHAGIILYQTRKHKSLARLRHLITYILAGYLFVGFLTVMHTIALGDRSQHTFNALHLGNIYLLLILFFILFIPIIASTVYRIVGNLPHIVNGLTRDHKSRLMTLAVFLAIAGGSFLFLTTFVNDHPYNGTWWFIHNYIMVFFTSTVPLKFAAYGMVVGSLLVLSTIRLKSKIFYLLYGFTLLFLMPSWLVEIRYAIIPISYFLLMRNIQPCAKEYALILYWIILCGVLVYGSCAHWFFP